MTDEKNISNKDLILYRFKDSIDKLKSAIDLMQNGDYKDSVGRSYYAIFTAARALLATRQLDSSKHSGVISIFNKNFVKEGIVPKEMSALIENAKHYRERADYGDFFIVSREKCEEQIRQSKIFILEMSKGIAKEYPGIKNEIDKILETYFAKL